MNNLQIPSTRILSIGIDSTLLSVRATILERAGYTVCSLLDRSIGMEMEAFPFDLVLLCHSIALDRAEEISRLVQSRNPHAATIRLSSLYAERVSAFSLACDVWSGPVRLLNELDRLRNPNQVAA